MTNKWKIIIFQICKNVSFYKHQVIETKHGNKRRVPGRRRYTEAKLDFAETRMVLIQRSNPYFDANLFRNIFSNNHSLL